MDMLSDKRFGLVQTGDGEGNGALAIIQGNHALVGYLATGSSLQKQGELCWKALPRNQVKYLRGTMKLVGASSMVLLCLTPVLLLTGCTPPTVEQSKPALKFSSEYQAVFMDNGQVLFGKLEQAGSAYPILKGVFTVQRQADQETKEVKTALVRRSVEPHQPDQMVLNAQHITMIESVGENSPVAQLIKRLNTQPTAPTKP